MWTASPPLSVSVVHDCGLRASCYAIVSRCFICCPLVSRHTTNPGPLQLSVSYGDDSLTFYRSDGAATPTFTAFTVTALADGALGVSAAGRHPTRRLGRAQGRLKDPPPPIRMRASYIDMYLSDMVVSNDSPRPPPCCSPYL